MDSSIQKQQKAYNEAEGRHEETANELQILPHNASSQQQKKLLKQRDALLESLKGEKHKLVALQKIQHDLPEAFSKASKRAEDGGEIQLHSLYACGGLCLVQKLCEEIHLHTRVARGDYAYSE